MRPLSATEAISPALEHTKALLRPFSLRLWLKLGFVAVLAEMGGQFFAPPMGNSHSGNQSSGIGAVAGGITPLLVGIILIGLLAGFLIALALLYLSSRLQLVLMDLVATRTRFVGPAWHRTASRTWRWIGGKVLCFFILFVGLGILAAVPIFLFIRSLPAGQTPSIGAAAVGSIVLFIAALFILVFVILLATWILRDITLPFILFEDASFGDALRRTSALIRNEPGPVCFYFLMKFVLCIVAGIAVEFCTLIVALVAAIPTGIIAFILWKALHGASPFETAMMYISFVFLGLIFLAALIVAIVCFGGAALIFYQAYALYFLGGRIPQIGILLEPPTFYPPMPAPPLAPA